MATPSKHPNPDGRYQFLRTGELPTLPTEIGIRLSQKIGESASSVSHQDAEDFINKHTSENYPELLHTREANFLKCPPTPGSRHNRFTPFVLLVLKDSAAGFYKASDALENSYRLFNIFIPLEEQQPKEFIGIVLWAIGQINQMTATSLHLHMYTNAPQLDSDLMKWVNSRGN